MHTDLLALSATPIAAGEAVGGEAAEVTGKNLLVCADGEPEQQTYKIMRVTKKMPAKAVRVFLCLVVLVIIPGCTLFQNRASGKSWSQIAAEEEQEQQLNEWQQGDWNVLPYAGTGGRP
jgi:hypothetical protein